MVALTDRQLAWLHSEVGSDADDDDLDDRYDRLESVRDVAIEVLRDRRADLLESPLQVNVDGVVSINSTENVKAIERRLTALSMLDDDPSDNNPPGEDADGTALDPADQGNFVEQVQLVRSRRR